MLKIFLIFFDGAKLGYDNVVNFEKPVGNLQTSYWSSTDRNNTDAYAWTYWATQNYPPKYTRWRYKTVSESPGGIDHERFAARCVKTLD